MLDEENKAVQEEEWRVMMEEKAKQLQEEAAAAASREDSSKQAKKDKKGGKASADKKRQKDAQDIIPVASAMPLRTEEFVFQRSKAFSGYRIGDTVALLKSKVSTVHCPDGQQVRTYGHIYVHMYIRICIYMYIINLRPYRANVCYVCATSLVQWLGKRASVPIAGIFAPTLQAIA